MSVRDVLWQWRHRRCAKVSRLRPEYRTPELTARACRRCRAVMQAEAARRHEAIPVDRPHPERGWEW